MLFALIKMVKAAIVIGIMVGLLMFADSNLDNMKLFTKILILVIVSVIASSVVTSFINVIGLRILIILVLLFLAMSIISRFGLFVALVTRQVLEDIKKWKKI